jgi:hypothetical protein
MFGRIAEVRLAPRERRQVSGICRSTDGDQLHFAYKPCARNLMKKFVPVKSLNFSGDQIEITFISEAPKGL